MRTEIEVLREEIAKLRERVAVLEARPTYTPIPQFVPPLTPNPGTVPPPWWAPPDLWLKTTPITTQFPGSVLYKDHAAAD